MVSIGLFLLIQRLFDGRAEFQWFRDGAPIAHRVCLTQEGVEYVLSSVLKGSGTPLFPV